MPDKTYKPVLTVEKHSLCGQAVGDKPIASSVASVFYQLKRYCGTVLAALALFSAGHFPAFAQKPFVVQTPEEITDSLSLKVFFRQKETVIDPSYHDNEVTIEQFISEIRSKIVDDNFRIQDISIRSGSSLEGSFNSNMDLSRGRSEFLKNYLKSKLQLSDDQFTINNVGEDWETFYELVKQNYTPSRKEVLTILENHLDYIYSKRISVMGGPKKELMDLNGGTTWFWLLEHIFPELRASGNRIVCHFTRVVQPQQEEPQKQEEPEVPVYVQPVEKPAPMLAQTYKKAECRLGTNLLYDAATVANLSLEVGFGQNFALNVLTTFSPWDIKPDLKLRTLIIQPELRYYFAKDFKGHYLGIEGHYGWYNAAFLGKVRYQDKDGNTPLWGAGLSYGYVVPFSKHWGMDFSISAGYAHLEYDCFYNVENGARYTTQTKDWWGPTKVGISIYYQF